MTLNICDIETYYCVIYYCSLRQRRFSQKNKDLIINLVAQYKTIIYGWGATENEPIWLKNKIKDPMCFHINNNGTPKHPLYIKKSSTLKKYKRV